MPFSSLDYHTSDEIAYLRNLAYGVCSRGNRATPAEIRSTFWKYARIILQGGRRWDPGVDGEAIRRYLIELIKSTPDLAGEGRPWLNEEH